MSTPGFWEIVMLGFLALLIFGPDKLPGMAKTVGKTLGTLKREAQSTVDELKRAADLEELREAGRELSEATREVERQANLSEVVSAPAADGDARDDRPAVQAPPPFDPDAT